MASKRAKTDFSPEAILREIREGKELFNSINSLKIINGNIINVHISLRMPYYAMCLVILSIFIITLLRYVFGYTGCIKKSRQF